MELDLAGKTAVVTGASKGIGLAVVQALVAEGVRVVAGARTVTAELSAATEHAVSVDLSTQDGPASLVQHAVAEFGGLDLLVNNVGGSSTGVTGFLDLDDQAWQHTFDLNFFSTVRATRAALPSLLERRGAVVNIGSVNSRLALPQLAAYAASKAALANLGKALAEEFGARGVRINTISPGPVRTDIWTKPGQYGDAMAEASGVPLEEFIDRIPAVTGLSTERWTEPAEVAALVLFLASGLAPNISGSDYVIDGGMLKTI